TRCHDIAIVHAFRVPNYGPALPWGNTQNVASRGAPLFKFSPLWPVLALTASGTQGGKSSQVRCRRQARRTRMQVQGQTGLSKRRQRLPAERDHGRRSPTGPDREGQL